MSNYLIKVCDGALAGTTFGKAVERMTGLWRVEARASRVENASCKD